MQSYERVPQYLKKYLVQQDYDKYTARDHAVWRYIMRQNKKFFAKHAVPSYLNGLEATGIPIDHIPKIEDMDKALARFGWGAVAVSGFIPPAAFIELQAHKILPIAVDMRTADHVAYTPAPDIVHEAAGHAPIVSDPDYASYLTRYAQLAKKAIFAIEDIRLYEAIRLLSDIKENPDMAQDDIDKAQAGLDEAVRNIRYASEATKVARLYWWTAEYGLLGTLENPKIYGAGLLSSVGESASCLDPKVKKIPLSLACVDVTYDITEPQPQLFVARDFEHLNQVLVDLEHEMAFKKGGSYGAEEALRAQSVCTYEFENFFQISGILESCLWSRTGDLEFIKLRGPSQICVGGKELAGQGSTRHPHGYSAPMGKWSDSEKAPWLMKKSDLEALGIQFGLMVEFTYRSGFVVKGRVLDVVFNLDGFLQVMTLKNTTVTRGSEIFYQPEWGDFDLVFGSKLVSVFGGPADVEAFGQYQIGEASSNPGRTSPFSPKELILFEMYKKLHDVRSGAMALNLDQLQAMERTLDEGYAEEWLIRLEMLEYLQKNVSDDSLERRLSTKLKDIGDRSQAVGKLIHDGLKLLK